MTTASDAVMSAIDSNWNVGTGGTKPVLYNKENIGQDWPPDDDWVMVKNWEYEKRRKRRNDSYVGEKDYVGLRVHSKNDANLEERLDIIVTEIYRVVTATNVTGYHTVDIVFQTRRASDKRTKRYIADLTVELVIKSTSSTATPGSTTTSAITVDELTVNTWITVGGLDIEEALMLGSANAAYVPMMLFGHYSFAWANNLSSGWISNVGADNMQIDMVLPMPCTKGGLKLYITNMKFGVADADGDDYLTTTVINGFNGNVRTQLDIDGTNHNSAGDKTFSGAVMPASAIDVSSYQSVVATFTVFCTGANDFDIGNIRMQCYYAA